MTFTHLSSVSALALALALGAPMAAQAGGADYTPPAAAATENGTPDTAETPGAAADATMPDTAEMPGAADEPVVTGQVGPDRLALDELDRKLEELGVEDRELFGGQVAVARTSEGDPTILLIGPEGFERGEVVEFGLDEFDELRDRLSDAGFEDVRQEHALPIMQGSFDDYEILATSGEPEQRPGEARPGATAIDRDGFDGKLGDAGIEDRTEFRGRLVRGFTDDNQVVTMLIGPSGFEGDQEVDLSSDELRERFEEAGVADVRVIEDNIYMTRGSYEDRSVLTFGGAGIADAPMATGAIGPAPQPDIDADLPDPGDVEVEVETDDLEEVD